MQPSETMRPHQAVLDVTDLSVEFTTTRGVVHAVTDVALSIGRGEVLGLVGESGSGKTTIARLLAGLETPDAGSITFRGAELAGLRRRQRRATPGIALMFQDAYGSLDPRMRAGEIVREPLIIAGAGRKRAHWRTVARLLGEVGLPADAADRYPGQFSGGQRQRLALARALVLAPALIIADEPVSALDVSVQAQILNLMRRLQRQYGLSYLLISHDLAVVRYMADEIAVLRRGELVEAGPAQAVCDQPAHPYTRELIDAAGVVALSAAQSHAPPGSAEPGPGADDAGEGAGEDAGEGARPVAAEPA
jgi:peptide/nickel transport system ATP-binding protein